MGTRTTRYRWGAAGLAAGLLALTACSSGSAGDAADDTTPADGGTLTFAAAQEPECWDPHQSPQNVTSVLQRPVFDSLVHAEADGSFTPWLASKWTVSPDGKTYTFTLRDGVTFSDGTAFDAAAVKANLDHVVNPATKSQLAASLIGPYSGSTVVSPSEVQVTLSRAYTPFLQALSTVYLGLESPKVLTKGAEELCAGGANSVGTGPFTIESYAKGQQTVLKRNAAYAWGPGTTATKPAHLEGLTLRYITEDSTRVGALTSQQVDVADALPTTSIAAVAKNSQLGHLSQPVPGTGSNYYLNVTRAPFTDEKVRQAFQSAIDLDTDVKTVFNGVYQRAWSPLSPSTPNAYDKSLENTWGYDPAKAGKLLDEAGWSARDADGYRTKDGKRLTIISPIFGEADAFNQAVQADLKKSGIDFKLDATTDVGKISAQLDNGEYDVVQTSWARADGDILSLFFDSKSDHRTGGHNFSQLNDPKIDALLASAAASQDPAERLKDYSQIQQQVVQQAIVVPAYAETADVGYSAKVHGLTQDPNGSVQFYGAWKSSK